MTVGSSSGTGDSDTDASVLLLDGSGRVRGDRFYGTVVAGLERRSSRRG